MSASRKAVIPRAFAIAVGLILVASHSAIAIIGLPPALVANRSNTDLVLSYQSYGQNFYSVQASPDLLQWSTLPGMPGDGLVDSVTVSNALSGSAGFYRLSIQQSLGLSLPQADAFAIVGYDCGGIKEEVYVTDFDPASGYIVGQVNLSTTCSGSGRDGGVSTTHTGAASVMWDLGGNVISYSALSNAVPASTNFIATDAFGDTIYNYYYGRAYAYLVVPLPGPPVITSAAQTNDQFNVSWILNGVNPIAVTSSTITATPTDPSASVLTATVSGSATGGAILSVQPSTTYQITVVNSTITGSSPPSAPITLTTSAPTTVPGAPTIVTNYWSNPDGGDLTVDTIIVDWQPGSSGNSPIDEYQVSITPNDGSGTLTQTISSPTLTAYFNVSPSPSWTITVQAHNTAGWGPWSAGGNLGGL